MKHAFELFCAAVRAGATPAELVETVRDTAPTVATLRRFAETGEVPAPPSLNEAIRRNAHLADEPAPTNTGDVPAPPSLNASVRAFLKGIRR
ncbi:MAG: hypothetical protein Q8O42_07485 [Acidobacteriota bacterium]|nr:hypothetical protein [Acidobacteriota bacterium]